MNLSDINVNEASMKLTKQQESEIIDVYEAFWGSLLNAAINEYAAFLDVDFRLIGTTEQEVFFNKQEAVNFLASTAEQMAGNLERRKSKIDLEAIDSLVLITEQFDAYVLIDKEWKFYGKTRVSSWMKQQPQGWKILQQHFSFPDTKAEKGQTIGLENIAKENIELREAIKRRTIELQHKNRELEIESALERVRAHTMAMHSSEDVGKCVVKMFSELTALGVDEGTRFGIGILNHENDNNQLWTARKDGEEVNMHIGNIDMTSHPLLISARKAWKEQVPLHKYVLEGEDLLNYYQMLNNAPDYKIQIPLEQLPKREIQHCFIFEHGFFYAFSPREFQPELIQITKRFSSLFEQTYRRYLDLVRAEGQAREAEIELALERVRARTMAMHHTEELKDVIQVVFDQFVGININVEHAGFILDYKDREDMLIWLADEHAIPFQVTLPYFDCAHWNSFRDAKEHGKNFFTNLLGFEEKNQFYKDLFAFVPGVPEASLAYYLQCPGLAISTVLLDNVGLYIEHFSAIPYTDEENKILMRFGKVFQQTYTRFLDLQKAEAQAHEARIEAALERVRAASMAMHKSDELLQVIQTLSGQLCQLGIRAEAVSFLTDGDENGYNMWLSSPGEDFLSKIFVPRIHDRTTLLYLEAKEHGKRSYSYVLSKEEKNIYFHNFFDNTVLRDYPDNGKEQVFTAPGMATTNVLLEKIILSVSNFGNLPYSDDDNEIINRIANVFQQSYTRFLDLQKAEAQAREAQIEAALERIRSKSLAMYKTDDLRNVVTVLFEQMQGLSVDMGFASVSIFIFEEGSRNIRQWLHLPDGVNSLSVPYFDHPILSDLFDARDNGADYFAKVYTLEEKNTWIEIGFELTDYKDLPEAFKTSLLQAPGYAMSITLAKNSGICIPSFVGSLPSPDDVEILKRVGKVFEQAYIRFLDLQKAEAQAREAQIENSLERVRSRTMAMQSSDELPEVANQLFTEVRALGIHAWSCGYNILADDKKTATCCMSSEGTMQTPFQLRLWGEASFDEMGDFIRSDKAMLVQELGGKSLEAHYAYMKSFPDLKPTFDEIERLGLSLPTYQINHLCKFTRGFILFITYEKVPDALEIFKRFTNVFDQTYIRFLDLKKAEAQAREAIKQAALERVRGEIASMRSANDLEIITPLVWRELTNLGIPFIRCGVFIVDGKKETVEVHLSSPGGKPLAAMHLAFGANDLTLHAVEAWKKNAVHVQQWSKADFINYGKQMVAQGQVKDLQSYQGDAAAPELLYLHFIPFSQGLLYVGSLQPLLAEQIQLVTLLAKSFAIAYARYEDFIKLEQAKAEVEAAMSELKATQSQLVQQEKLASLGQLTAGIAHEIKNPLNFVNNFTEVSIELIEEAIAEIQKHDNDKDASLIDHNLDDIKANLKKVYEHGTRANSIVNSMLMHSRGGGGAPEPTLLNDFIREYSNLAFHGMRAGKDPLDVQILFQWDENIREIPLIVEDFSRVVLNICNNAFDAMREKKKKHEVGEDDTVKYKPTLSIKTTLENGKVRIQFQDNGPGISDAIRDKILQPFFTTKKGTEGTGLGLSISHDIVKAHGGAIQVETKEGEGSVFIIILPENNI